VDLEPWATYADVIDLCPACAALPDSGVMTTALQVATEILYELTGRQWPGIRSTVERPIWCGCQRHPSECECGFLSEVVLSRGPVVSVSQVKMYGDVIDPARYRLDGGNRLVWMRDPNPAHQQRFFSWPACQILEFPDTELWTWSVSYTYGRVRPEGGRMAAATLGCQLAIALGAAADTTTCRLPQRVTNITRQGVSMVVLDPMTLIKDGLTGLAEVDLWVSSVRIGRGQRGGGIMIPGRPKPRITG
jgi:hypothetical protein